MGNEPLSYYRWYVHHHRANRRVQRMGYIARGLLRELLDEEWLEGGLPDDIAQLADICDCPVEVMEIEWPKISACFERVDGKLVSAKLEGQRTEQDTIRAKRMRAGRMGAIAKHDLANAKQMPADDEHLPYREKEEKEEREERVDANASVPLETFVEAWNTNRGVLPEVKKTTPARRKKLRTRIAEGMTLESFTALVKQCAGTPFLRGVNDRGWMADFDWLVDNSQNHVKVLEGKYGKPENIPKSDEPRKPVHVYASNVIPLSQIRSGGAR